MGSVVISAVLVLLEFHLASGGAFEQPPVGLVLEFGEICYSILYICVFTVTADGSSHHLIYSIPRLHHRACGCGILVIGSDLHCGGYGGSVALAAEFPLALVHPFASVYPTPSCPYPARMPHPLCFPVTTPYAPRERGFLRLHRYRAISRKAVVAVISCGIGRRVLVKVNDVCGNARLACGSSSRNHNTDIHCLLGGGSMPLAPHKL